MNNIKRELKLQCETPDEIKQLAQQYGYKYRYLDTNTVEIISKLNEWVCCIRPTYIEWKHKNRYHDTAHYHPQRICYDFEFIFKSIKTHEQYEFNKSFKKKRHWENIFNAIENNTYNQIDRFKWQIS
jgi:hypothetical protein